MPKISRDLTANQIVNNLRGRMTKAHERSHYLMPSTRHRDGSTGYRGICGTEIGYLFWPNDEPDSRLCGRCEAIAKKILV